MSLAGIEDRDATIENRVSILNSIFYSRFLRGLRIACQLTFERYCREGGVRVCGDAVLLDFWCGVAEIFILSCSRNFLVVSMRFAVFSCYSVWYFLCGFAVFVSPGLLPLHRAFVPEQNQTRII